MEFGFLKMNLIINSKGFTLAEILVTLGVIGVIAAMTVPALVQDLQDAQFKTSYKKAFATANQAWMMAANDNLIVPRTIWSDAGANLANFNTFKSKFNIVKDCNTGNNSACWLDTERWGGAVAPNLESLAFIDSSGYAWITENNTYGTIFVDTNGLKGPNRFGKDRFPLRPYTTTGGEVGLPVKISTWPDVTTPGDIHCLPSPPCYFTSWLKE